MRNINFKIDINKQNYIYEDAMQNDDIVLQITLFENGIPYNLGANTVTLNWLKADGTFVLINTTKEINIINNVVNIILPRDCTRAIGEVAFELSIKDTNNKQISTFPVSINVIGSVLSGNKEPSKNLITSIEELENVIVNATNLADTKKTELDTSIANAQDDINTILSAGNKPFTIPSTAWIGTEPNLTYALTHNLNSKTLIVQVVDTDTQKSMLADYRYIDMNSIELQSIERKNITVSINASYYTGKDANTIAQEVIDARKGEISLKSKIDGIDSQLAEMSKLITGTSSAQINSQIEEYTSLGYKCLFPYANTYEITEPIIYPSNCNIDFNYSWIKRKSGLLVFDLVKGSDIVNGNVNIRIKNLYLDGNCEIDNLDNTNDMHRFSGLKLEKVVDGYIKNIYVKSTVNAEDQVNTPASGIFFKDCINIIAECLDGKYNKGTAIFINNSKVRIDKSKTSYNLGSGISSNKCDGSEFWNLTSNNNGYSNISINGEDCSGGNFISSYSKYSGVNLGHIGFPTHRGLFTNINTKDNDYEGITIVGSNDVQIINFIAERNKRNNIKVDTANRCKLINGKSKGNTGGHGLLFTNSLDCKIDFCDFYESYVAGIWSDINCKIDIGDNVKCWNNNISNNIYGAGIMFNQNVGSKVGQAECWDDRDNKLQKYGLAVINGTKNKVYFPNLHDNLTTDFYESGTPSYDVKLRQPTSIISITPLNAWVTNTVGIYYRDSEGYVNVDIVANSGTLGTDCCVLPVGFRPASLLRFDYITNGTLAYCEISTGGGIKPYVTNNNHVVRIRFKAV